MRRLVVHAAVDQVGQLGPFRSRQLVPVLVKQPLLLGGGSQRGSGLGLIGFEGLIGVFSTLELSSVLSGLSPLLQISHRVVPKPHLSVARLRFWGFSMISGGTQGIRSTRTEREEGFRGSGVGITPG